jgi:hypothetical protein
MKSLKSIVLLPMIIPAIMLDAQTKGVVVDQTTGKPVANVSVYTRCNGEVSSTASNENGEFSVDFSFDSLFFSHINYEKIEVKKKALQSRVELLPVSFTLNEVVIVGGKQPAWIAKKLKETVKQKAVNYQIRETPLAYDFTSTMLDEKSGYSFKSRGILFVPKYSKNPEYKISPRSNVVFSKDSIGKMDFDQFRRMLYDNPLQDFDNSFVNNFKFAQNHDYETDDENIVALQFQSKKYGDDFGYIVVDTNKNVILEFERTSGLKVNLKKNISPLGRRMEKMFNFVRNAWNTYIYGKFELINGSYQMTECKYQWHMDNKHNENVYIFHTESFLTLRETEDSKNIKWLIFPNVYYKVIYTKNMRLIEEALQNLPKTHEKF